MGLSLHLRSVEKQSPRLFLATCRRQNLEKPSMIRVAAI